MLNAKNTPAGPPCLPSSGLTIVLIQGWSYRSDAGAFGYSSICMQSKAKGNPFLDGTLGNGYPLAEGDWLEAELQERHFNHWETVEMSGVSALEGLNPSLFHGRWFVSVNHMRLVIDNQCFVRKPCTTNEAMTTSNILKDCFKLWANVILNVLSKSKAQF